MVGGESLCGPGRGYWARCLVCFGGGVGIAVEQWVNEMGMGAGMGKKFAFFFKKFGLGQGMGEMAGFEEGYDQQVSSRIDHRGKKIELFLMGCSKFVCCGLWD